MIKIIVPGREQTTTYRGTCSNCGCVVECDEKDFIYEDRPCGVGYISCPTKNCNKNIVRDKFIKFTELFGNLNK